MQRLHITTCSRPIRIRNGSRGFFYVGCGHCPECTYKLQAQWHERMVAEYKDASAGALYVTLTYDNDHLPKVFYNFDASRMALRFTHASDTHIDFPKDEIILHSGDRLPHFVSVRHRNYFEYDRSNSIAVPRIYDVQNLIKNLRSYCDYHFPDDDRYSFRYFYVSEYGEKTFRPHYHMLFFFRSHDAKKLFKERLISEKWSLCSPDALDVQDVLTEGCFNYVSKYVNKRSDYSSILNYSEFRVTHNQSRGPCFGSQQIRRFCKNIEQVPENRGCYLKAYTTSDGSIVTKNVPYSVSSTEQYFPKLCSSNLLSDADLRGIFGLLYQYKNKPIPNYIKDVEKRFLLPSDKANDRNISYSWCSYMLLSQSEKDIEHYLFGIPQNRTFCKRVISQYINNVGLSPDTYFELFKKHQYNLFYNSYSRMKEFQKDFFYDPLRLFMYSFPTFDVDFGLPKCLTEMNQDMYNRLDLLLWNYDLCPEDLYNEDNSLRVWLSYLDSSEFKEWQAYVKEDKLKNDRRHIFNNFKYKNYG